MKVTGYSIDTRLQLREPVQRYDHRLLVLNCHKVEPERMLRLIEVSRVKAVRADTPINKEAYDTIVGILAGGK